MSNCHNCNAVIESNLDTCHSCGSSQTQNRGGGIALCYNCGNELVSKNAKCSKCYIAESVAKDKIKKMKASNVLLPNEKLLSAVWGRIESSRMPYGGVRSKEMILPSIFFTSRTGLLGLTTHRIIFYMPKIIGRYEFDAHEIDQIDNVTFTKGLIRGRIDVSTHNGNKIIKRINNEEGKIIVGHIQTAIQENKQNNKTVVSTPQAQNPMDLLKTQFVNGEITEDEFEKKKKVLES